MAQQAWRGAVGAVSELAETQRLAVELCRRTTICLLEKLSASFEQSGEKSGAARLRALEGHMRAGEANALDILNSCVEGARLIEEL